MSKYPRQVWRILFRPAAMKQLRALTRENRQGVFDSLRILLESENPYALPHVKKLEGKFAPLRRVRSGDYRIFFEITPSDTLPGYKGELRVREIVARKDAY